jgi:hypothetical protein
LKILCLLKNKQFSIYKSCQWYTLVSAAESISSGEGQTETKKISSYTKVPGRRRNTIVIQQQTTTTTGNITPCHWTSSINDGLIKAGGNERFFGRLAPPCLNNLGMDKTLKKSHTFLNPVTANFNPAANL